VEVERIFANEYVQEVQAEIGYELVGMQSDEVEELGEGVSVE